MKNNIPARKLALKALGFDWCLQIDVIIFLYLNSLDNHENLIYSEISTFNFSEGILYVKVQ